MNEKKWKCLEVMNQIQRIHRRKLKDDHSININLCHFSVVLSPEFEEFVKSYAENVHDQWSYAKVNPRKIIF
jgi:hypothetical protein